jgi:hypothetical protein
MGNTFPTTEAQAPTLTTLTGGVAARLSMVTEAKIRQLQTSKPMTGTPQYAAVRPKSSDGGGPQRWEVVLYPTPDSTTTLSYRYTSNPQPLSDARPYPVGGPQQAELLLQSCLALAEQRKTQAEGPATARFMERLAAAIQLDVQTARPTDDGVWPIGEEPDGLGVDREYLRRLIGRQMQFGPNPGAWSHRQASEVDEALRSGLRQFYQPVVLPGERYAHSWSFLRPLGRMATQANVYEYDLPEDFAMLDGPLTCAGDDNNVPTSVRLVSEHQVRAARVTGSTSRPEIAALRVKTDFDSSRTRWSLIVAPIPDDTYTLEYRYKTTPGLLSSSIAVPAGGPEHSQTIIASCLMAADELRGVKDSPWFKKYIEHLKTSVSNDRVANAPDTLSVPDREYGYREYMTHVVTYNGVEY